jgi:hypothetical protein
VQGDAVLLLDDLDVVIADAGDVVDFRSCRVDGGRAWQRAGA